MTSKKLIESIPDDLRVMAEAYSLHNRTSNRIWLIAATITLIIVSSNAIGDDEVRLFGLSMEADRFYPISVVILSLVNIAYCTAHMQSFFALGIIQDRLVSIKANEMAYSQNYSLSDVVHSMYASNLKRIYPLARLLPSRIRYLVYMMSRVSSDLIFLGLPVLGSIWGISKTQIGLVPTIFLSMLVLLTALASVILFFESTNKLRQDHARLRY